MKNSTLNMVLEELIPLLKDEFEHVSQRVVFAIESIHVTDFTLATTILELMSPMLNSTNEITRNEVGNVIVKISCSDFALAKVALPLLIAQLISKDGNRMTNSVTIQTILKISKMVPDVAKFALELMLHLLKEEYFLSLSSSTIKAIGHIVQYDSVLKELALKSLIPLLKNKSEDVRCAAIDAITIIIRSDAFAEVIEASKKQI
jgi:HEAT repeat protein